MKKAILISNKNNKYILSDGYFTPMTSENPVHLFEMYEEVKNKFTDYNVGIVDISFKEETVFSQIPNFLNTYLDVIVVDSRIDIN